MAANKKVISLIIKVTFIGMLLFTSFYIFDDELFSLEKIKSSLYQVEVHWLVIGGFCGVIGNFIKAFRWKLQMTYNHCRLPVMISFSSIVIGLICDFLAPRLGELSRVYITSHYINLSYKTLVSHLIWDRGTDILIIVIISILAAFWGINVFDHLRVDYFTIIQYLSWAAGCILVLGGGISLGKHHVYFLSWIAQIFQKLWCFILSYISNLRFLLFVFLGALTWYFYFLQTYLALKAFFGNTLPVEVSLMVFLAGVVGMMIPLQGGIGSYHALVTTVLISWDKDPNQAFAVAIAIHLCYTVFTLISAIFSGLYLLIGEHMKVFEKAKDSNAGIG